MSELAENISADQNIVHLDEPLATSKRLYRLENELVEVTGRGIREQYDRQAPSGRIVNIIRGAGDTTAASHASGVELVPYVEAFATSAFVEPGGGGVTVDNQSDPPEDITTLRVGAAFGPEGTATVTGISEDDSVTGASATVTVQAPENTGSAEIAAQALASGAEDGSLFTAANADEGVALVSNRAFSASGTATAQLDAEATSGNAESRVAVTSGGGVGFLAGVVASHVDGVEDSVMLVVGDMAAILKLADDGSLEHDGGIVRLLNVPTTDPVVAGQLWIDTDAGRVLKVSAG